METSLLAWAVCRAALVAIVAVIAAHLLRPIFSPGRWRPVALAALLVPWFTPSLLTGYAWSETAFALARMPFAATLFYSLLLVFKFTPAAALALHLIESPVSPEAVHCQRLAPPGRWAALRRAAFLLRSGAAIPAAAAWLIVFLFAFPEFELASLLNVHAWTVTVFDAHAGGVPVSHSLRLILPSLAVQIIVIAAVVRVCAAGPCAPAHDNPRPLRKSPARTVPAFLYLAVAGATVTLIPCAMLLRDVAAGVSLLARTFTPGVEIATGLAVAALASVCAVGWCMHFAKRPAIATAAFAGLAGTLTLSLATAWVTARQPFLLVRDTHIPLVLILTLSVLPLAFVAVRLGSRRDRLASIHAARLLGARRPAAGLMWELRMRAPFLTTALLFFWVYWELTASSILAPIGVTPVSVRLYNLMHYGHTSALSGMLLLALAAPIIAAAAAYFAGRTIHAAWCRHG